MSLRINKALTVILISLLAATFSNVRSVYAATTIYVEPPSIIDPTMDPGRRFNVTVWVSDVSGLFAWQVKLYYNFKVLNVTRAWQPIWDPQYVFYHKASVLPPPAFSVDNIFISDSLFAKPTFTGSGKLAIIEFQVIGRGSSILNINNIDTLLLDYDLNEIPVATKTNGYFENKVKPPPATIYVDPARVVDPLLVPSNNFSVSIKIVQATDVYSFDFKLSYNQTLLNVVDVTYGDFFPSSAYRPVIIDNTAGYVVVSAELLSPPSRSGNGTLAIIKFHVESFGACILDLNVTKLADEAGDPLDHSDQDGYFNNILLAKLYIDPPEIIDPLLKPPKIFSVDVVIDDVENLYSYEFRLSYNTKMLTTIGVFIHPILNETNFTTNMMVDDDTGEIWVRVRYYSPANPITTYTPQSLVTLTFKVDAIGSSVLDLYDTKLTDSIGADIKHEVKDGFVMTLIRDVAIVNVVPSASFAYAGALVSINVTAKNKGNNKTETFDVSAFYDTNLIGTKAVTNLPPNAETTLTFTWNTTGVSDGNYTIKGEATFVPYEFNTTNNVYIDGTVQIITRIRDLAILNVTVNTNITYAGWPVNITVVAENQGMDPETFDVSVYWNDTNLIGKQTVTDLAPNTTITLTFIWDTTNTIECHKYKISAEVPILPFEIDIADNKKDDGYVKIKIMGDINSDGKVDIRDVAIVAQAFGSYPGHPRWNPDADLDRNGKVDIRDLAMCASNFGKTCP